MNKRETHIVTGMTRDLSASRFDNKFVVDARNIRITSTKGNSTLLSVTNEKGTAKFSVSENIKGLILGHAVLNNILVLFTTEHTSDALIGYDRIYRLDFSSDFSSADVSLLFEGDLNFYYKNPLETLPYYETDSIKKVYWVDGRNQPRMIDIERGRQHENDAFDFNRKIEGNHTLTIQKYNTGGQFPAGTIQYCFNYFNKFGQETNLVDVSPLYYLSPQEKGLPADAMDNSSFVITIENVDPKYEYIRLYSIIRTSENAVPNARIVGDYKVQTTYKIENVESALPVGSTALPVVINQNNLCVIDINTKEVKYKLIDKYGETTDYEQYQVPLLAEEYLYDQTTGKVYFTCTQTRGGGINADKQDFVTLSWHAGSFYIATELDWPYILMQGDLNQNVVSNVTVVDNGIIGSTIDASSLLFIGGQDIIAQTLTSKTNTLFLGNIRQNVPNIGTLKTSSGKSISEESRGIASPCVFGEEGTKVNPSPSVVLGASNVSDSAYYNYQYDNNKSSYDKKSFKAREGYRLGFIAQYNTGQWSEVIWIDDLDETFTPSIMMFNRTRTSRNWGGYYKKPGFEGILPVSIVNTLIDNGFIRVAPVVCYPEDADRKVPFQGLLSGTVYNVLDRNTNSPFVQADWRFRVGYGDERINGEIQCNTYNAAPNYPVVEKNEDILDVETFLNYYGNQYYRDSSILTFHSPDVEFREDMTQGDLEGLKMRIVGLSTLSFVNNSRGIYSNQRPERTLAAYLYTSSKGFGKNSTKRTLNYFNDWRNKAITRRTAPASEETTVRDYLSDLAYIGFYDNAVTEVTTGDDKGAIHAITAGGMTLYYNWIVYLWHRNGSLNNQKALSEVALKYSSIRYAMLEKKCISETQYARTTFFQTPATLGPTSIEVAINEPVLYDSDQLSVAKISFADKTGINYYGAIDKVITPSFVEVASNDVSCPVGSISAMADLKDYGYPIEYSNYENYISSTSNRKDPSQPSTYSVSRQYVIANTEDDYGVDPVHMRYKSTKHVVIGLASEDGTIVSLATPPASSYQAFWENNAQISRRDALAGAFDAFTEIQDNRFVNVRESVYIAELYREFSEERAASRFGGTSDNAIINNVWKRCGDSVRLVEGSEAIIYFKEGDTYIGRYDCLKTYPYSQQDQNQIVSIYSTELESRVNLDARYDKNRGLTDNTFAMPSNFDLFNHLGYEQTNQYFTYKAIDYDKYNHPDFPNLVTISLEKKSGADIDAWTSIPMTSTYDLQGDLGEITKLTSLNDSIYSFQNRGVAQILFNERVQIPASDGLPIEITNGLKLGGYRYLSDQIGMTNKWSLCTTPNGMYFIDDEKNTLYLFNGQQLSDISGKAGFRTWLSDNNSYDIWNPVDYGNIKTWYDKVNGDVYFMGKKESLVFSEQIGNFISFMDYGSLPMLVNMNDRVLVSTFNNVDFTSEMWELWAGDYNTFFGSFKPYWLTFISNTDPTVDKVFDNLAWRTFDYSEYDDSDKKGILQPMRTFDTLRVWHDHQDTGDVALTNIENKPSPLKKKFNVFRALVPRDKLGLYAKVGRDRIRNTWTYIQLSRYNPNTDLMIFNDLDVDFFE